MTVFRLFSRRTNAERTDLPPLEMSQKLRTQVCHTLRDGIGNGWRDYGGYNTVWKAVHDQFIRELGVLRLTPEFADDPMQDCLNYLLRTPGPESVDLVEMSIAFLAVFVSNPDDDPYTRQMHARDLREKYGARESFDDTVSDLNSRFRENGMPLQFVGRQLVRTDSEFLHEEATAPAFGLLHDLRFKGAEHEFVKAHEHYRHGR